MTRRRRVNYSGRPTPRKQRVRPGNAAVALFCGLMAIMLLVAILYGVAQDLPKGESPTSARVAHDSLGPTYTHDGGIIRWYVFIDPDKGVQYLVNDRGGCCPRLDEYGSVMGVQSLNDV